MGIMSKFLGKKKTDPVDYSVIGVDMHSHFIPGVDDGSPNLEVSLQLIGEMAAMGYKKLITTPHIMVDYYPNVKADLKARAEALRHELKAAGVDIALEISAEYYADNHFMELIERDELMPFGDNYILFEVSFSQAPDNLNNTIFELQHRGYKPILAHPERYPYWVGNMKRMQDFLDRDVLLQLNINSLTGTYSPQVAKFSEKLLDSGMIAFLGSDCHHEGHQMLMKRAAENKFLKAYLESGVCLNGNLK